jgi:hypothetical protein
MRDALCEMRTHVARDGFHKSLSRAARGGGRDARSTPGAEPRLSGLWKALGAAKAPPWQPFLKFIDR